MRHKKLCMKARFATVCISCGDQIEKGKEIGKDPTGKWVHRHCIDDLEGLP